MREPPVVFFFLPSFYHAIDLLLVTVALAPLEEDETVFTVPRSSVLSIENSELFEKLREELTGLYPWLVFP